MFKNIYLETQIYIFYKTYEFLRQLWICLIEHQRNTAYQLQQQLKEKTHLLLVPFVHSNRSIKEVLNFVSF